MGYCHYWQFTKLPSKQAIKIVLDQIIKIRSLVKVKIQLTYDNQADPIFTDERIRFNGVQEDGHEDFSINFTKIGSNSTKTNYKPYDRLISLILLSLKNHIQGFNFSSDGDQEQWQPNVKFYTSKIREFNKLQKWDPQVLWNRYKYQTVSERKQRQDRNNERMRKRQQVRRQINLQYDQESWSQNQQSSA